jgi:hypothetical protein
MARALNVIAPWRVRALTIPPKSLMDWLRLAVWEFWMGSLMCALLWAGGAMISTSPDRIITAEDISGCYASPPVVRPCERIVYRTGAMNAAFSVLSGFVMIIAGLWLVWELWDAAAPKPITDDFLKLLSDSFARSWRDPRTWPWSRVGWAYGFTVIGFVLTATAATTAWTLLSSASSMKIPAAKVGTSEDFKVGPATAQPQ